jgi:hypothetical protein
MYLPVVPSQICSAFFFRSRKESLTPAFQNDEYEVREAAGTMDPLTPDQVAFPGLAGLACRS